MHFAITSFEIFAELGIWLCLKSLYKNLGIEFQFSSNFCMLNFVRAVSHHYAVNFTFCTGVIALITNLGLTAQCAQPLGVQTLLLVYMCY